MHETSGVVQIAKYVQSLAHSGTPLMIGTIVHYLCWDHASLVPRLFFPSACLGTRLGPRCVSGKKRHPNFGGFQYRLSVESVS